MDSASGAELAGPAGLASIERVLDNHRGRSPRSLTASLAPAQGMAQKATPSTVPHKDTVATVGQSPTVGAARTELTSADHARIALCIHEAGHAIGGVLLGGLLAHAGVGDKSTLADAGGSTTFVELGRARHAEVAFAGPWATARHRAGRRPSAFDVDAALGHDGGRHCDRTVLTAAGTFPSDHADLSGLLERCWPSVVTLAKRLFADGEVRHKHVLAALGVSHGDTTAFELANLRAGLRGVPHA